MAAMRTEGEAARIGFHKVRGFGGPANKSAWSIKCASCQQEFRAYWPPSIPPQQMLKNMRTRGWDVGLGERPLCKLCAHPASNKAPKPRPDNQSFAPFMTKAPTRPMFQALSDYAATLNPDQPLPPSTALLARGAFYAEGEGLVRRIEEAAARKVKAAEKLAQARDKLSRIQAERIAMRAAERAARKEARMARPPEHVPAPAQCLYHAEPPQPVATLETAPMTETKPIKAAPTPSPKITFAIYGLLESLFDKKKRLYMSGYNDARLAKEVGTTEDVVAWLRKETFGELASDPRLSSVRDDIEFMKLELVDYVKTQHLKLAELASRVEQLETQMAR